MKLLGTSTFLSALDDFTDQFTTDEAWVIGTNVEYAIHQEYGTRDQAGTPHVRPAIDDTRVQMARFATRASGLDEFMRLTALYLEGEIRRNAPVDTGHLRRSYTSQKIQLR